METELGALALLGLMIMNFLFSRHTDSQVDDSRQKSFETGIALERSLLLQNPHDPPELWRWK